MRRRLREEHALETELDTLIRRGDELNPSHCTDTQICHIITTHPDTRTP